MSASYLALLMVAWAVAAGSPGPATLAISGTAMAQGRRSALLLAAGVLTGSASWGCAAALGMSAVMYANAWLFEVLRYFGAAYLLFLAVKSLRSAFEAHTAPAPTTRGRFFLKGALLHLTNPKAIFAWGSVFSIALPAGSSSAEVWEVFALLLATSAIVFFGYAALFSVPVIASGYRRARRWFELTFAVMFGYASLRFLTSKIEPI